MSEKEPISVTDDAVLTYELDDDQPVCEGVVTAVADAADAEPTRLEPLATGVDPDALDAVFGDRYDDTCRTGGRVTFQYAGYEVVVTGDSHVAVLDQDV